MNRYSETGFGPLSRRIMDQACKTLQNCPIDQTARGALTRYGQ